MVQTCSRSERLGRRGVTDDNRLAADRRHVALPVEGNDLTGEERRALHEALSTSRKSARAGQLRPSSADEGNWLGQFGIEIEATTKASATPHLHRNPATYSATALISSSVRRAATARMT